MAPRNPTPVAALPRQLKRGIAVLMATTVLCAVAVDAAGAQTFGATIRAERAQQSGTFAIPLGKSQLLRVDRPFTDITIGNPEVADVVPLSNTLVYVLGKSIGTTNLTVLGGDGQVLSVADVVVSFDVSELRTRLFQLIPGEQIEVRPAGSSIVLSGQVSSPDRLANALAVAERYAPGAVTNMMTVGGSQQVLLQVRFAEVERASLKRFGISNLAFNGGDNGFTFSTGDGVAPDSFATGLLSLMPGSVQIESLFDTLEEKGLARLIAEPNLVVLSGNDAFFLAGGEFPIPVAQNATVGATAITVEFKEFGASLAFTPTVVGADTISMELNTEVSTLDPNASVETNGISIPGLKVRRANTSVELRDGQSLAIAGLLQDDFRDAVRQFPWLGDLPIIGALLRSTSYERRQTELVILITPRLVQPVTEEQLATPTAQLPTEQDLFLLGRTSRAAPATAPAGGGLAGDYGYILQ